jgi:hypothetical protein
MPLLVEANDLSCHWPVFVDECFLLESSNYALVNNGTVHLHDGRYLIE